MTESVRAWKYFRWGILFRGSVPGERPHLLGAGWEYENLIRDPFYPGEPGRALLFTTRRHAREWCAKQHAKYAGRDDVCAKWRFTPVRVIETVRVYLRVPPCLPSGAHKP